MGRVVGFEPTRNGATIRRVNRFTIPATEKRKKFKPKFFALQKRLYHDTPPLSNGKIRAELRIEGRAFALLSFAAFMLEIFLLIELREKR